MLRINHPVYGDNPGIIVGCTADVTIPNAEPVDVTAYAAAHKKREQARVTPVVGEKFP